MKKIQNTLTFARCHLSNKIKKFIFETFDGNINNIIDILENKIELPNEKDIQKEIKDISLNKCDLITLNDSNYPIFLKETSEAPILLSIKGDSNICRKNNIITSSGARDMEFEDISTIANILNTLKYDFIIASGLALGSDAIAHMQTYKTGAIAVLANGLGYCYPKENQYLIEKIVDNSGCIISEYSYNKKPTQQYFLQRDKLLAGISASTLIMRAKQIKSGTIATANVARKLNRKLYTILPEHGKKNGNQWLLDNQYASLITDIEELKYNLLIDIATLINEIETKQSMSITNKIQLFTQQKFDYNDKTNISNEIKKILQLIKVQEISFNNLISVYEKIGQIQPNFTNNKIVKQILIENVKTND